MKSYLLRTALSMICCVLWSSILPAQSGVVSSGQSANNASGESMEVSIGQIFYGSTRNNDFFSIEGVQQPYEILVNLSFPEHPTLVLRIWPNPATEQLYLETSGQLNENLKFEISDIHGRVVYRDLLFMRNRADVSFLAAGTYFITFISSSLHKKSFKFIKL